MNETTQTEEKRTLLPHWMRRSGPFDDRLDVDTDLNFHQSVVVIKRSLRLLLEPNILPLFLAKGGLALGLSVVGVVLVWVFKLIPDHVILGLPIDEAQVNFPDFMWPFLRLISGLAPMEIMLTLSLLFAFLLMIFGTRAGGTGAQLYSGRDAAGAAENAITEGGSEGGSIWGLAEWWVNVRLTQRLTNSLRTQLFRRIIDLPMKTLHDQRIGDSIYRVLYDTPELQRLCFALTFRPFFIVFTLIVTLYLLENTYGTVNSTVVYAAIAILPLTLIITIPATSLVRRVHQSRRAAGSATTNALEESVDNMADIQSLGSAQYEKERFESRSALAFFKERHAIAAEIFILVLIGIAAAVATVYIFIVVSNDVMDGRLTPGDFVLLTWLFLELAFISAEIGRFWITIQEQLAAVRRVFFLIDLATDQDLHGLERIDNIQQGFELESVSFGYIENRPLLRDVLVSLNIGEFVAILGPTGSGKTTLAQMLPGFIHPDQGHVRVDGLDVRSVVCESLRQQVAYVFQEHEFYGDTIREFLQLAKPDTTDEEIRSVLDQAQCSEFVNRLQDGIDTLIGKGGKTLSVGQQQRISIARGLLRDTPVLILDEPTADLDPMTEKTLINALRHLTKNRLVVIISHRLSTIRAADKFIVINNGLVTQFDSYDELRKNSSLTESTLNVD